MAVDTLVTGGKLTAIANAIRAKTGGSALLTLDDMPTEIASIGGGTDTLKAYLQGEATLESDLTSLLPGFCIYSNPYVEEILFKDLSTALAKSGNEGSSHEWSTYPTITDAPFIYGCPSLERIDMRSLPTGSGGVYAYGAIAYNCRNLKYVNLASIQGVYRTIGSRDYTTRLAVMDDGYAMWLEKVNLQSLLTFSLNTSKFIFDNQYVSAPTTTVPKLRICLESATSVHYGFRNIFNLESLYLPNCNYLLQKPFQGVADGFKLVLSGNSMCALYDTPTNAFQTPNGDYSIYVPQALLSTYRAASNWSTITSKIFAIEDYPDVVAAVIADSDAAKTGWD